MTNITTGTNNAAPEKTRSVSDELKELRGLVSSLTDEVKSNKDQKYQPPIRSRVKVHYVTLREFMEVGVVKGIVTKLYDVREIKDKTEAKKFMGVCKVDILNPKTKETKTYDSVDYLDFLDKARRVKAKVLSHRVEERFEVDERKGGGGVGVVYKQGQANEYVSETEFPYEVGFADHTYTLSIEDGEFQGETLENDGKGLNI